MDCYKQTWFYCFFKSLIFSLCLAVQKNDCLSQSTSSKRSQLSMSLVKKASSRLGLVLLLFIQTSSVTHSEFTMVKITFQFSLQKIWSVTDSVNFLQLVYFASMLVKQLLPLLLNNSLHYESYSHECPHLSEKTPSYR